ncbi:MAG: peptidylprolyl isomerase [bacterium]
MTRCIATALAALCFALPAAAATHTVRNTEATGDGSLRQAIEDATDGDVVLFGSNARGTITVEDSLELPSNVTVKGPGADVVTVKGSGEETLALKGGGTISGLTIAGGETALKLSRGKVTLLDCAIRDSSGAGINVGDAKLTMVRTLITANQGAGVEAEDGAITCVNSTIADNGGAGLRVEQGTLHTANCTIAANRGAGIEIGEGEAEARNTLLVGNLRACAGTVTSKGYNLVDEPSCAFSGPGDVQTDDPRLGSLGRNGGPTETIAPTGGSQAIEGGDPSGCADPASNGILTVDQRGQRRPSGARCDIGAFETPAAVTGRVINRIVALVDGDPITLHEVRTFATSDPRLAQANASAADVLELLITQRVLEKEIEAQGIVVSDAEIDRYMANVRQRNNITDEQLDTALAQQGLTRPRYRQQIKEELQRAQLINREIRGKVSVSPEEIDRYQKEHGGGSGSGSADTPADADAAASADAAEATAKPASDDGEQVSISHIVLQIPPDATEEQVAAVQARADKIYDELQGGADFAEVAKRESEDGVAKVGGKLGTFRKTEIKDELANAVADLSPGEVGKPVRVSGAIHIVKLDDRISGGAAVARTETAQATPAPNDPARDEIKEKLYSAALEERYMRWLKEDLRQRHSVEIRP